VDNVEQVHAYSIIHKNPGYHKICARSVPKECTDEYKWTHVEMCMQLLQQYQEEEEEEEEEEGGGGGGGEEEEDTFLYWTVTVDETWVHHYEAVANVEAWSGNTCHHP